MSWIFCILCNLLCCRIHYGIPSTREYSRTVDLGSGSGGNDITRRRARVSDEHEESSAAHEHSGNPLVYGMMYKSWIRSTYRSPCGSGGEDQSCVALRQYLHKFSIERPGKTYRAACSTL
jgi:hypothetical protein